MMQLHTNQIYELMQLKSLIIQGGGTAAHLMLDLWPSLQLEGWEIDPIVRDIKYLSVTNDPLTFRLTFFFSS